jgi:hypothetical protein
LTASPVVFGVDGVSDFNALHSRKYDDEVRFCAFDILAEGGVTQAAAIDAPGQSGSTAAGWDFPERF